MSEYQHYEWQTIDRTLTPAEQKAVNGLSSHIDVSASQAVVTYEWGDFKHDPQQVLARYFDAFLYFANWGTRWLMFRFPKGRLDLDGLAPYLVEEVVRLANIQGTPILEIRFEAEDLEWEDFDDTLTTLAALRNDLLQGDYRCLYLAWLREVERQGPEAEADDETPEPPIPAGLGKITPALREFARFIGLDPHLIQSAAAASQALPAPVANADLRPAIHKLPRAEADAFLVRLLEGEGGLSLVLRQRLLAGRPRPPQAATVQRTRGQLLKNARQIKRAEAAHQAAAAEKRRIAALQDLAKREAETWQAVEAQLEERKWTAHAKAVEQLRQLRDLADYQNQRAASGSTAGASAKTPWSNSRQFDATLDDRSLFVSIRGSRF